MDEPVIRYEVYREVFIVTEWKDDSIYATQSDGFVWVEPEEIKANRPRETNRIYAVPSTNFVGPTIRHKTV